MTAIPIKQPMLIIKDPILGRVNITRPPNSMNNNTTNKHTNNVLLSSILPPNLKM